VIRVVMFDLGDTLIWKNPQGAYETFPQVTSTLAALGETKCADGTPLLMALVSDYERATNPQDVLSKFTKFLGILKDVHLVEYFQPVDQRVTLSTHAGVTKPDPKVFELALQRLGIKAPFSECLFITENSLHIRACKSLGMGTLQFGLPEQAGGFPHWNDAFRIISGSVSP